MPFSEDLSAFLNTDEFASAATYDGATSVNGILEDQYSEVFQGEQVGVSTTRKAFRFDPADISDPVTGKELVIGSDTYTVRDIEEDNGLTRFILELTGVVVTPPAASGVFSNDFSADFA